MSLPRELPKPIAFATKRRPDAPKLHLVSWVAKPRSRAPAPDPPSALRVQLATADLTVVELCGDIDVSTAPHLLLRLLRLPPHDFVVDLSRVTFMGVAGMTLLMQLRDHLLLGGGTLRLAEAPPTVLRLIALTELQDFLPCWRDVAEAVDRIKSGPSS